MRFTSRNSVSRSPERLKAYTDAVVAIAQTLLILPLLESVSEARAHHLTTAQWLTANGDAVIWLAVSFVLIGTFWASHHRVFEYVEHPSEVLQSLNFVWMFAIVCFPVIAAVLGLGEPDAVQKILYVGCMLVCSLAMNGMVWQIARDPRIRGEQPPVAAGTIAVSFSLTLLYALGLLLALLIPGGTGYFALFVLILMPVAVRSLVPLIRRWNLGV